MKKYIVLLLLLCGTSFASKLDSKSLMVGISIGAGSFVTRNYVALPAARTTAKAAKKTARATKHVATLGRR